MSRVSVKDRLLIDCPSCHAELVIDRATGEILSHKEPRTPPAGGKTFEGLFEELKAGKERAEDLFEQERAAQKDRDRLLSEKFEEALKRAESEPDEAPPLRPFDLD